MLCVLTTVFSQAGQKWATSGNAISNGDFIGSTNNQPVTFKTNNTTRGLFTSTGSFQLTSLAGTGFRLLQTDASGTLSSFTMGSANDVLFGDGVWRPLPPVPSTIWDLNGTSAYYLNGKVGIGTKTPFTNFDVIGDAYISNNLYVGGGIIITEKVNANVEVATAALRADSIVMDSTKAVYGYSIFKDKVKLENKLEVVGNTQINGDFRVNGDFIFGNNKRISYLPPSNGNPEIIGFGRQAQQRPLNSCLFPTIPLNQIEGVIQSFGNNGAFNNVMTMGFDGANGIIEMEGTSTGVEPRLLINYWCGKDVFMNTGANGGNVIMTSSTKGKVGIGTDNPLSKLHIENNGNVRITLKDATHPAGKYFQIEQDKDLVSFNDNGTKQIISMHLSSGNVGIGTMALSDYKLSVEGKIRAREIEVNASTWADFVFAEDYPLKWNCKEKVDKKL